MMCCNIYERLSRSQIVVSFYLKCAGYSRGFLRIQLFLCIILVSVKGMIMTLSRCIRAAAFIFLMLLGTPYGTVSAQEQLTVQIHPYLPPTEVLKRFNPLMDYLRRETGMKITCNISRNYKDHIEMVGRDSVDVAFLGPASYVKVVSKYGKKPILARLEIKGTPFFRGVIISREQSSIEALNDLKGRRFAFGDQESTMSHLLPLYLLKQAHLSPDDFSGYNFLNSHQNVALGVLMGDFDAGAVKEEIFYQYRKRGLRDIAWTPKISEHLFVARSSLPEKLTENLRQLLFNLKHRPDAAPIMSSIKEGMTGFIPAADEDYHNLREILTAIDYIKSTTQ